MANTEVAPLVEDIDPHTTEALERAPVEATTDSVPLTDQEATDRVAAFESDPLIGELPRPKDSFRQRMQQVRQAVSFAPVHAIAAVGERAGRRAAMREAQPEGAVAQRSRLKNPAYWVAGAAVAYLSVRGIGLGESVAHAATLQAVPGGGGGAGIAHHVAVHAPSEILNGKGQIVAPDSAHVVGPNVNKITETNGQLSGINGDDWRKLHDSGITAAEGKPLPAHDAVSTDNLGKDHVERTWHDAHADGLNVSEDADGNARITYTGGAHQKQLEYIATDKTGAHVSVELEQSSANPHVYSQVIDGDTHFGKAVLHNQQHWGEVVHSTAAHGKHPEHWDVYATDTGRATATLGDAEKVRAATTQRATLEFMDVRHHEVVTSQGTTNFDLPKDVTLEVAKDGNKGGYQAGHILLVKHGKVVADLDQSAFTQLGKDGKLPSDMVKSVNDQLSTQGVELKGHTADGQTMYRLQETPVKQGLKHVPDLPDRSTQTPVPDKPGHGVPTNPPKSTPSATPTVAHAKPTPTATSATPTPKPAHASATATAHAQTETPKPKHTASATPTTSPKSTQTPLSAAAREHQQATTTPTPSPTATEKAKAAVTHSPTPTKHPSTSPTPVHSASPTPKHSPTPVAAVAGKGKDGESHASYVWAGPVIGASAGAVTHMTTNTIGHARERARVEGDRFYNHLGGGLAESVSSGLVPAMVGGLGVGAVAGFAPPLVAGIVGSGAGLVSGILAEPAMVRARSHRRIKMPKDASYREQNEVEDARVVYEDYVDRLYPSPESPLLAPRVSRSGLSGRMSDADAVYRTTHMLDDLGDGARDRLVKGLNYEELRAVDLVLDQATPQLEPEQATRAADFKQEIGERLRVYNANRQGSADTNYEDVDDDASFVPGLHEEVNGSDQPPMYGDVDSDFVRREQTGDQRVVGINTQGVPVNVDGRGAIPPRKPRRAAPASAASPYGALPGRPDPETWQTNGPAEPQSGTKAADEVHPDATVASLDTAQLKTVDEGLGPDAASRMLSLALRIAEDYGNTVPETVARKEQLSKRIQGELNGMFAGALQKRPPEAIDKALQILGLDGDRGVSVRTDDKGQQYLFVANGVEFILNLERLTHSDES
jgi:hypothetical protein